MAEDDVRKGFLENEITELSHWRAKKMEEAENSCRKCYEHRKSTNNDLTIRESRECWRGVSCTERMGARWRGKKKAFKVDARKPAWLGMKPVGAYKPEIRHISRSYHSRIWLQFSLEKMKSWIGCPHHIYIYIYVHSYNYICSGNLGSALMEGTGKN